MKLFGPTIFLFLLCSCSQLSTGYKYADFYLERQVNKFVDLSDNQEDFVEKEIDRLMKEHKKNIIPLFISQFEQIAKIVKSDVTISKPQFDANYKKIKSNIKSAIQPFIISFSNLLVQLNDKQIKELDKRFLEQNKDIKKYLKKNVKKRIAHSYEKIFDFWEDWLIELNEDTSPNIRPILTLVYKLPNHYLSFKRKRQQELIIRIKRRDTAVQLSQYLNDWFFNKSKFQSPIEFKSDQIIRESMSKVHYSLLASLNRSQRLELSNMFLSHSKELKKIR